MLHVAAAALILVIAAILVGRDVVRSKRRAQDSYRHSLTKAHRDFVQKKGEERAAAAEFLAQTEDPHVIPTLLRGRRDPIGSDPDDEGVYRALRSLCEVLRLDAVQVRRDYDLKIIAMTTAQDLLPWFDCSDPVLRDAAMRRIAAASQGPDSEEFTAKMLDLAFSCSAEFNTRLRATETLAMAHREGLLVQRAIEILETKSDNRLDREDAIEVLSRFNAGAEAVPCLVLQAQESKWGMSQRAIRALTRVLRSRGETLPTAALESIEGLLSSPILLSVADPEDPSKVTVETVNTEELQTLVSDLLAHRQLSHGDA